MSVEENGSLIEALRAENAAQREVIEALQTEVEQLKLLVQKLKIQVFGKKSEKLASDSGSEQASLFSFDLSSSDVVSEDRVVEVPAHERVISRGRKPLSKDIPCERIEYEPEERTCSCCGAELVRIGEEITEELDFIPARFVRREHVKVKRTCNQCKGSGVKIGVLPPTVQPLERSRPGPGLLSQIIVSKYLDHLPLNRQEAIFARQGVILLRARMCDWIAAVCELMKPLYEALRLELISLSYLQADETSVKVQVPDNEKNILSGYFWGLHSPVERLAYFEYYPTRASEAALKLLEGFSGTVQTDFYAGYNQVLLPGTVMRLACMAHVRRKFIEAQSAAPEACRAILELISKLYKVEAKIKKSTPEERKAAREKDSAPIIDKLHALLCSLREKTLPKHPFMNALQYALSQWDEIVRFLDDGAFEIDNNYMERDIRPIAIGRKNWLFAGSHNGAKRAAMLYSFFACCKLHKVNAFEWLKDVVVRVQSDRSVTAADLLPHRWKSSRD